MAWWSMCRNFSRAWSRVCLCRPTSSLELGNRIITLICFSTIKLRRYVVLELKARAFEPGDGVQLGMYMHAVNGLLLSRLISRYQSIVSREKNRVLLIYFR